MGTYHGKMILFAVAGGFAVTAFSGCNDTGFASAPAGTLIGQVDATGGLGTPSNPGGVGNTNPPGCTIGTSKKPIRVMFMVDNSGSTLTTDPNKVYRLKSLQKFQMDYGSNTNLSYTFSYFAGTSSNNYDVPNNKFVTSIPASPVGNSSQLASALSKYDGVNPNGNTPYKAAFTALGNLVNADAGGQDYAVAFLSDGQPTDVSGEANLRKLVSDLKAVAAGKGRALTVNTIYFGDPNDKGSFSNLDAMAKEGNGQFVDTNLIGAGGSLVINDVINVPGANCQ